MKLQIRRGLRASPRTGLHIEVQTRTDLTIRHRQNGTTVRSGLHFYILPHDSHGDLTPVEYRVLHHFETSSNGWH